MSEHKNHCMQGVMSGIIEVRYSDLEEEYRLSAELLKWAEENQDIYAEAFAHTYLGDYYIAQNDNSNAVIHLAKARELSSGKTTWDELMLRLYSLLGIYYEKQSDEQNSIQYYLDAIAIAQRLGDITSECIILNNLGVDFLCHHNYETAMEYFKKVYNLQKDMPETMVRIHLLGNLVDVSLRLGQRDEARRYILEGESGLSDEEAIELFRRKNWCCYYGAVEDSENALHWAELVLEKLDVYIANQFEAFENFNMLCESMLKVGDKKYSKIFLKLMEENIGETLEQQRVMEEKKVNYSMRFESEEKCTDACKRFYNINQKFKDQVNASVVDAMKVKIDVVELKHQKEYLEREQESFGRQANFDELTQLYNRRYLTQKLKEHTKAAESCQLGIIMLDIDYFKEYNDFYGHVEGDRILQSIGNCLWVNMKEGIYPCRYGGDEFICLCENLSTEEMEDYIKQIRSEMNNKALWHKKSLCSDRVTLSIGYVNERSDEIPEMNLLLQLADQALYDSKLSGRNTYRMKSM